MHCQNKHILMDSLFFKTNADVNSSHSFKKLLVHPGLKTFPNHFLQNIFLKTTHSRLRVSQEILQLDYICSHFLKSKRILHISSHITLIIHISKVFYNSLVLKLLEFFQYINLWSLSYGFSFAHELWILQVGND